MKNQNEEPIAVRYHEPLLRSWLRNLWPSLLVAGGVYLLFTVPFSDPNKPLIINWLTAGVSILLIIIGAIKIIPSIRIGGASIFDSELPQGGAQPELAVSQLSKNYEVLRRQTTQGFILSGVFMALGFLVILFGSVGTLFGLAAQASNLTTVAGLIMEFISGTSLLIYRINFKRLNQTTDKLDDTWRVLTAYRLAEGLPEEKKSEATMKLIEVLIKVKGAS